LRSSASTRFGITTDATIPISPTVVTRTTPTVEATARELNAPPATPCQSADSSIVHVAESGFENHNTTWRRLRNTTDTIPMAVPTGRLRTLKADSARWSRRPQPAPESSPHPATNRNIDNTARIPLDTPMARTMGPSIDATTASAMERTSASVAAAKS
jgi:hypothetical protein